MKATLLRTVAVAVIVAVCVPRTADATVVGFEDFDGGAVNLSSTANVEDYPHSNGNLGDVFGRLVQGSGAMPFDVADDSAADVSGGGINPGDSLGIAGRNTSNFFAMNDADATTINNATWTFNIASALSLTSISMDIAAMGDFEASSTDGFRVEARVDSNAYSTIFLGRTNEAISHTYRAMDDGTTPSHNDPLELFIDGSGTAAAVLDKSVASTGNFDTYTSVLLAGLSGTSLDIRISWEGTPSGSEAMGFDNITINAVAVPEASSFLFGGLTVAMAAVGYARRRRT